jgi:hypothetical protein
MTGRENPITTSGDSNEKTFLEGRKQKPLAVAIALADRQAGAATLTVTNGCTLADAITAANNNTAVGGYTAGDNQDDGDDIIELTADVVLTEINNTLFPAVAYRSKGESDRQRPHADQGPG